jgi:hypothetical protein
MKKVCAHDRKLNNGVLLKNPSKEKGKKSLRKRHL